MRYVGILLLTFTSILLPLVTLWHEKKVTFVYRTKVTFLPDDGEKERLLTGILSFLALFMVTVRPCHTCQLFIVWQTYSINSRSMPTGKKSFAVTR